MPKWKDLKRYCERDHWELYKETDHYFFRKVLDDGTVLRTKVSKGSGEIHGHCGKKSYASSSRQRKSISMKLFEWYISFARKSLAFESGLVAGTPMT